MNQKQDHFLINKGPRAGEKINLTKLPLTIGRLEPGEARIDLESVSRKHARISRTDSGYLLEDLGSSNGTYVNDERIDKPRLISNGDHVRLGSDVELFLVVSPAQKSETNGGTVMMDLPDTGGKTVSIDKLPPALSIPPQLVVNETGRESKVYALTAPRLRIGRQPDNDVVIDNRFVSRYHAELEQRGQEYYLIPSSNISNSLLLDGQPVMEPIRLHHGARIRIGGFAPGEIVTLDYLMPAGEADLGIQKVIQFSDNTVMTIGRDADNDIVLPAPTVSRYHAEVEKIGQRYRVRDLHSSNGTFVNGKSVTGDTWVHPGDAIQIGPYRFAVDEHEFAQSNQTEGGVRVEVFGLNKWVNRKLNILQDISLVFQPREFIVVVGQSGGGKSTLVDAIAGHRPASHGRVIVNSTIDVYKEFDAIRSTIGYVPQKDIIHMELTVFQALDYAARLRMPSDTTKEERIKRVEEVMKDLDLSHRRNIQISRLSGGQQKRVSIGVELLNKPGLFFLDEPTSGLDPGMETELMRLMRRLADQGRTIVMITHATKNVMLADRVVFLARGGYLTWFGPPEEALNYFDQYRTEKDRRSSPMEFDHIYTLLDNEELGSGPDWAKRFRDHPAYAKYISEPLKDNPPTLERKVAQTAIKPQGQRKQVSALRQFLILSERNLKITARDRLNLVLLILTAPAMASLDFVLASGIGRDPFSFKSGNFNDIVVTLIALCNTAILVGGLPFMRELVKERDIYKRERMVNLQLFPYVASKIWFGLFLAVYQAGVFTAIRYIAFNMPGGTQEEVFFFITAFLLIVAGMMLGLFVSAAAPNANTAPLILILLIIPQLILSGAMVPLSDVMKAPASSRWAFQAFLAISGAGSDVAADSCWNLTKAQQDALSLDQKNATCRCMGENALHQTSCNFPGLGKYYNTAIDQKDPAKPVNPGPQPAQPTFPPQPAQPADINNLLLLQKYLNDLTVYNTQASQLRDQYQQAITAWQQKENDYSTQLINYQTTMSDLVTKRAVAVGAAESTIRRMRDEFGWTFINKHDQIGYYKILFGTWAAQLFIIFLFFVGMVIMQRRREVA